MGHDLGERWLGGLRSRVVDNCFWVMISGGWQLHGHNQVELAVVGMSFFFFFLNLIWVFLGLRCKSCDVGCLELFGSEKDEWVVICGVDVNGHMMLAAVCLGFVLKFFIYLFGSF